MDATDTTWAAYSQTALATAIYPERGNNLMYAALGLCGEAGELFDIVGTAGNTHDRVVGELGDVAWYTAVVAYEAAIAPHSLGAPTWQTDRDPTARIVVAAARIAELVKKTARDHNGRVDALTRAKILSQLDEIIDALGAAAANLGLTLDDLLDANTAKLASRAERGQLHGNGDFR